jgi:hypothetical protein
MNAIIGEEKANLLLKRLLACGIECMYVFDFWWRNYGNANNRGVQSPVQE